MKIKIKSFLFGFDYAVKNYEKIEDHHFHSLPGASWSDKYTNHIYRKGIKSGRKYMQYRYEVLAFTMIFMGIVLLITT